MADRPEKKNQKSVTRNDSRSNGKAAKTDPGAATTRGRTYRGSHTRRTPQTELQKVLLGGGLLRNTSRGVDGTLPWKLPQTVHQPYDAAQVQENKRLYPHLFTER